MTFRPKPPACATERLGWRALPAGLAGAALLSVAAPVHAQLVTGVIDRNGVYLPCVTVGPLAPIVQEYCVRRMLAEGFVLTSELGATGLTIGSSGSDDARVSGVQPGSAAAQAGLNVGDRIVSVDGVSTRRTPENVARQLAFGARDDRLELTLRRDGTELVCGFKRGRGPEPPDTPKSPNILVGLHPLVSWDGRFIPCMGAGVLGPVAIGACLSHYRKDGFVRVGALGSTGIAFDPARTDAAIVAGVDPGSPAATADVRSGDEVTAIDGRPLTVSQGKTADALLFGRAGAGHQVLADRQGRSVTVQLVLLPTNRRTAPVVP